MRNARPAPLRGQVLIDGRDLEIEAEFAVKPEVGDHMLVPIDGVVRAPRVERVECFVAGREERYRVHVSRPG